MKGTCTAIRTCFADYLVRRLEPAERRAVRDHLDICTECWSAWNAYRWDRAADSVLLAELRTYLEETGQPYTPARDSSRELAATWNTTGPTADDRTAFFRKSEAYLYNLVVWHASGNRPSYVAEASPLLAQHKIKNITEVGSGIGSDTLALTALGHAVTPIDYDSPSTQFARWRQRRAGIPDVVHQPGAPHGGPAPEALWIIDTLDHIPNPEEQLGPLLAASRIVVAEAQQPARAHGSHGYYIRRTPDEVNRIFAGYGLAPASAAPAVSVWRRSVSARWTASDT